MQPAGASTRSWQLKPKQFSGSFTRILHVGCHLGETGRDPGVGWIMAVIQRRFLTWLRNRALLFPAGELSIPFCQKLHWQSQQGQMRYKGGGETCGIYLSIQWYLIYMYVLYGTFFGIETPRLPNVLVIFYLFVRLCQTLQVKYQSSLTPPLR